MNLLMTTILSLFMLCGSAWAQTVTILGPNNSLGGGMSASGVSVFTTGIGTFCPFCFANTGDGCSLFKLDNSQTILMSGSGPSFNGQECLDVSDTGLAAGRAIMDAMPGQFEKGVLFSISSFDVVPDAGQFVLNLTAIDATGQIRTGSSLGPFADALLNFGPQSNSTTMLFDQFISVPNLISTSAQISEGGTYYGGDVKVSMPGPQSGPYRLNFSNNILQYVAIPPSVVDCFHTVSDDLGSLWSVCNGLPYRWDPTSTTASLIATPPCGSVTEISDVTGNGINATGIGCGGLDIVWGVAGASALKFTDFLTSNGYIFPNNVSLNRLDGFNSNFTRFIITVDDNGIEKAAIIDLPEPSLSVMSVVGTAGLVLLGFHRKRITKTTGV